MLRTIVQPAELSGEALTEFKDWLGISRAGEDGLLVDLLTASLAVCEAFTGQTPLEQRVEERLPPKAGRYCLSSRPVQLLLSAETNQAGRIRTSIAGQGHGFTVDHLGIATAQLNSDVDAEYIAVQMIVGIAPVWAQVPKPLRQGIIRLASHYYRDRDTDRASDPPASIVALWRPWRVMRLT